MYHHGVDYKMGLACLWFNFDICTPILFLLQEFKRETRFTSKCAASEIINKIEEAAKPLGFDVHKKNYKVNKWHIIIFE